jgi:multidrug efflux pump
VSQSTKVLGFIPWTSKQVDPAFDGDQVIADLEADLATIPGIRFEILNLSRGPASVKPVHLRLKSDNWEELIAATSAARAQFEQTAGLITIEDSLPLPGIDWQIDVDVEKAGRYGADVASVGAMVQMVTRGILLDTMRVDSSDEEIEIRVSLPEQDRVLSTLDSLRVRTNQGLIPLSNFITRTPVEKLAQIDRVDQKRYFDVKAGVEPDLFSLDLNGNAVDDAGNELPVGPVAVARIADENATGLARYDIVSYVGDVTPDLLATMLDADTITETIVNPNERIERLTEWLDTTPFTNSISWEWTGDQEDQEESGAFLQTAFAGALGLMFIILLAQFNSFYNAVLVLLAVVMSTAGSLVGMLVMDQPFSIIMTGTGIVALAGIVVNNNIILIDTYQEYSQYMPRTEAITRTAEDRIRPVLLTTITTMAGLAPMMFGLSLDFMNGGYSVDSPTSLWWKQLATAVVFGLGIATVLTLIFTPSMLAVRVWIVTYAQWFAQLLAKLSMGRSSRAARDWALARQARRTNKLPDFIWTDEDEALPPLKLTKPLQAAE